MSPARSRRDFLATTGALGLGLSLAGPGRPAAAGQRGAPGTEPPAGPYAALRRRWLEITLGTGFDPAAEPYAARLARTGRQAAAHRAGLRPAPGSLWPDLPYDPPAGITASYRRLETMARAWAQPGTGLTGDPGLAADVTAGLDHLDRTVYHPGTTRYGNWWEWQIGSPRLLLDTLAVLHDTLPPGLRERALAAVDHFVPDEVLGEYTGVSTGANRVDLCRVVALRGVLGEAPAKLTLARDALSPVFPYVTRGDGLYADGSFIQHTRVPYTGTYGQVLLDGLGRLFTLLAGSPWEVTDPGRHTVHDGVERAWAPLLYDGLVMDSVSGRAVSRGVVPDDPVRYGDHQRGHQVMAAITLLALALDAPDGPGTAAGAVLRDRWHALVKGWIERDTWLPVLTDPQFDVADLARLHAVAASPVPAAPEPTGHRIFAAMDRAVHRRPGWAVNIAMASDRIAYYENGNGENPRGWHTGAGMLHWWGGTDPLSRHGQYTDAFWPTADPYRLPGITVSAKRLADDEGGGWGEPRPDARRVGGTTDGEFAALGQDLRGLAGTLRAKKSWFCLDDAVVCLAAGITARDGTAVETVIDHRNLGAEPAAGPDPGGPGAVTVDGVAQPDGTGWSATFRRAHWVHLRGHGGYVLPGGGRLHALREARTGAWRDINDGGSPEPFTRRYLTLRHDHGTDPVNASCLHLLMPGATPAAVAARAADRHWLRVLENSDHRQGVLVDPLGVTAVNFWRPGTAGPLTATAPASVLVRRTGTTAVLCVAEPARTGTPLTVVWHHPVRAVTAHGPGVEVLATGRALRLRITPGTACVTHRCTVTLPG
ncbi:polysaccharide lyase 8 family protein [Streptomyces pactum]|uniref:Polysaccharide lyase 8 family protein n=1 Tax=Streptomyces pactum TaxID=68249 RepID=A0ABS0NQ53_9ACTN|nr:polysaccharide lyase 8 family protein [Streptomyces pactum]MBH5337174.1 polysaccharide lyase 8 family protein [Streptomyces pactum]